MFAVSAASFHKRTRAAGSGRKRKAMTEYYYPVDDAIVYFTNRIGTETNAAYAKRLTASHPNVAALIEKVLAPSLELEKKLDAHLAELDPECEFFFGLDRSIGGEKQPLSNAAWLLLGYRAGLREEETDLDAIIARRLALTQEERDRLFLSYLFDLEDEGAPSLAGRAGEDGLVPVAIARSGVNSLTRIKLIELSSRFEEHILRLGEILRPAVKIIIENVDIYERAVSRQLAELASYGDLAAYVRAKHGFELSAGGRHVPHISVLAPHTVNIRDGIYGNMDVYLGVGVNELAELLYSGRDSDRLASVFKLLSDQTRLEMLQAISRRSMYGLELAEAFSVTAPTVSYHMTKLVMSGLAESYFEGGKSYFKANMENLSALRRNFDSFFGLRREKSYPAEGARERHGASAE